MIFQLAFLIGITAASSAAQGSASNFVIDSSKPYVFIRFDHVAAREPLSESESPAGIWLRLTNNCQLPIEVLTFDPGTRGPGLGLQYEVIPVLRSIQGGVRNQSMPAEPLEEEVPKGYSFDVGSPKIIPAGGDLLFSVPSNHVRPHWYVRVKFALILPATKTGRQPSSFVDFTWADIPDKERGKIHP